MMRANAAGMLAALLALTALAAGAGTGESAKERTPQKEVSAVEAVRLAPVAALQQVSALTVERLAPVSALKETSAVHAERLVTIAALWKREQSRFDAFQPGFASKMWVIRTRALEAEKQGKNTDELWDTYWRIFSRVFEGSEN